MVDTHDGGGRLAQSFQQPVGDSLTCPVSLGAGRGHHFLRLVLGCGHVDTQSLEAAGRGFCTRVVDADVALELRIGTAPVIVQGHDAFDPNSATTSVHSPVIVSPSAWARK